MMSQGKSLMVEIARTSEISDKETDRETGVTSSQIPGQDLRDIVERLFFKQLSSLTENDTDIQRPTPRFSEGHRSIIRHALRDALREIKFLPGIVSICACCQKAKDKRGEWVQIDEYIYDNTDAEVSHGYCPECAKELLMQLNGK